MTPWTLFLLTPTNQDLTTAGEEILDASASEIWSKTVRRTVSENNVDVTKIWIGRAIECMVKIARLAPNAGTDIVPTVIWLATAITAVSLLGSTAICQGTAAESDIERWIKSEQEAVNAQEKGGR